MTNYLRPDRLIEFASKWRFKWLYDDDSNRSSYFRYILARLDMQRTHTRTAARYIRVHLYCDVLLLLRWAKRPHVRFGCEWCFFYLFINITENVSTQYGEYIILKSISIDLAGTAVAGTPLISTALLTNHWFLLSRTNSMSFVPILGYRMATILCCEC